MEVEVYADLLFLINAGMDGLCLSLTARLLHRRMSIWRLLAGAGIGGAYAVVALFLDTGAAMSLALDTAVCLLMCAVVFWRRESKRLRRLGGAAAVFVVLSMVMGGVMTALFGLFNRLHLSEYLPAGEDGVSSWLFALVALAGGLIALGGGRLWRRAAARRDCRVTVEVDGRTVTLQGLCDSGNLLRDPLGGRPVICADADALGRGIAPSLLTLLRSGGATEEADPAALRRLRFIPTATATGGGMLVGIRPDRVLIMLEGRRGTETREVDAIIAIADGELAGPSGAEAPIEALVPSELVS